jgi:hypothetical protein
VASRFLLFTSAMVALLDNDPIRSTTVGLDDPTRAQVVHGTGNQDLAEPELLAPLRA